LRRDHQARSGLGRAASRAIAYKLSVRKRGLFVGGQGLSRRAKGTRKTFFTRSSQAQGTKTSSFLPTGGKSPLPTRSTARSKRYMRLPCLLRRRQGARHADGSSLPCHFESRTRLPRGNRTCTVEKARRFFLKGGRCFSRRTPCTHPDHYHSSPRGTRHQNLFRPT
jgi:hypothetical protein